MLGNALIFIAQVAFGLLTLTLLLRFYLQWVRACGESICRRCCWRG
jgi:hypothetical protein